MRHVVDVDDRAVDCLDRQVVEVLHGNRAAVQFDVVLELSYLLRAGRDDQILRIDRVDDVVGRNAARLQQPLVEIDLHLARTSPVRKRNRRARNAGELCSDEIIGEVVETLLRNGLAGKRQLNDRDAGGVIGEDERRRAAWRQLLQPRLRTRRQLTHREVNVRARVKEVLDNRNTRERL